jgi:Cu(I)/Ag(I) efflux system periplasmic protein CusF
MKPELSMKLSSLVVVTAMSLSGTAFAQTTADHSAHHPTAASAAAAATSDGEVRKVDKEQGKVTLKHGLIANLDMPGMTMVVKVADPKMLDSLKPGDKVKFAASNTDGAITVTAIEAAK